MTTAYKYTVDFDSYGIYKYQEDDEEVVCFLCFEDFKDAKNCLIDELNKRVDWAKSLNSRNYDKC